MNGSDRQPGFLGMIARGALLGALCIGLYGVAEAMVNEMVGLTQPLRLWIFIVAIYAVLGTGGGALAAVVAWLLQRLAPTLRADALTVGAIWSGWTLIYLGLPINDRYLPGLLHPKSLAVNGLVTLLCAGLLFAVHHLLRPRRGLHFLFGVAALSLGWGLLLAGGFYVDMFVAGSSEATIGPAKAGAVVVAGALALWALLDRAAGSLTGRRPLPVGLVALAIATAGFLVGGNLIRHSNNPRITPIAEGKGRPNVIWLVTDTVRADHLGIYGYDKPTSPRLDQLGQGGVVFEQAISQAPWTIPSHWQMVTGRYAAGKSKVLGEEFQTFAEIAKLNGYDTAGFFGNYSLGRRSGFSQGLDITVDGPVMIFFHKLFDKLPLVGWLYSSGLVPGDAILRWLHRHTFLEGESVRSNILVDHAIEWIGERQDGKPFFVLMNFMDAHDAYDPPEPFRSRFAPGIDPLLGFVRFDSEEGESIDSDTFIRDVLPRLEEPDWKDIVALYDGEIAFLDSQIGRLLDYLEEKGLAGDTIVVQTSDHGELFGEHGLAYHFKSLSEEETHVPLLLRYPRGLEAGRRVPTPVELNDIVPTLVELARLEGAEAGDGSSLVALARGAAPGSDDDIVFTYLVRAPRGRFPHTKPGHLLGARSGGRKYVWSSGGMHEIYDLDADPKGHRNLQDKGGDAGELPARLSSWRSRVQLEEIEDEKMDRLTREKLKALGYID